MTICRNVLFLIITLWTFSATLPTVAQTTWLGGSGTWRTHASWSGGEAPQNCYLNTPPCPKFFNVVIDSLPGVASTVTIDDRMYKIDSLVINENDTLQISHSLRFDTDRGGFLHNDGDIVLSGTGTLDFGGISPFVLTGSGTITLAGDLADVNQGPGFSHLINSSTIQGYGLIGNIGSDGPQITNQPAGAILANVDGETLSIDPNQDGAINLGTMLASNGGNLRLKGGNFQNDTVIEAMENSTLTLDGGAAVVNGTLRSIGSGSIEVLGSSSGPSIMDLTLEGTLNHYDHNFYLYGNIDNQAEFNVIDGSMVINGIVEFSGGGSITLGGPFSQVVGSQDTVANIDNSIRGYGRISVAHFFNQSAGLIDADVFEQVFEVRAGTDGVTNEGIFRASNGGILRLFSGEFDNQPGRIEALDDSTITIVSATVTGGVLETFGSGAVEIEQPGATLVDLDVHGTINVTSSGQLNAEGTIENHADVNVRDSGRLVINSPVVINGSGSLNLIDPTSQVSGVSTLVWDGGTISGVGRVNVPVTCQSATIAPGNSIGELSFFDDVSFGSGGLIEIEIENQVSFDVLDIPQNTVTIACDLAVDTLGFRPAPTDTFVVMSARTLAGSFSNVAHGDTLVTTDGTGKFTVNYGPASAFDPNAVVLSNYQEIPTVQAEHLTILRGVLQSGGILDLADSDDVDIRVRRNPAQLTSTIEIELRSTTNNTTPSMFGFTLEASGYFRSPVTQSISLWDHDLQQYVEVDLRPANPFVDSTVTALASGDLSRFVDDATGEVRAKIRFESASARQAFSVGLDQAFWSID